MRISLQRPATRRDCILDSKLSPEQAADFSRRLDDGLSMAAAAQELLDQHGIKISAGSISRWAAKRRRVKEDATRKSLHQAVDVDGTDAALLASRKRGAADFMEANLVLASRALFAAQCNDDAHGMLRALKILQSAGSVAAQAKRAEASRVTSEARQTQADIALKKTDAEVAKAASEQEIELEKVRQMDPEIQRAKIARIVERTFGKRPERFNVPLTPVPPVVAPEPPPPPAPSAASESKPGSTGEPTPAGAMQRTDESDSSESEKPPAPFAISESKPTSTGEPTSAGAMQKTDESDSSDGEKPPASFAASELKPRSTGAPTPAGAMQNLDESDSSDGGKPPARVEAPSVKLEPSGGRGHRLAPSRSKPKPAQYEPWLKPGEWFRRPPVGLPRKPDKYVPAR